MSSLNPLLERAILRAALHDLAAFRDHEETSSTQVADSAFCPGGRFAVAPTTRAMPDGLKSYNFTTVGEWRVAIKARLDAGMKD